MYQPGKIDSSSLEAVANSLRIELNKLAAQLSQPTDYQSLKTLHAQPGRVFDGMIVKADGTSWNPGSGAGLYVRVGSSWVRADTATIGGQLTTLDGEVTAIDTRVTTLETDLAALETQVSGISTDLTDLSALVTPPADYLGLKTLTSQPTAGNRFEGMIVKANGTTWNPGSGAGVYLYRASAWRFLG